MKHPNPGLLIHPTGSSAPCPRARGAPEPMDLSGPSSLPVPCFGQGRSIFVSTTLKINSPVVPGAFYPPCSREYQYKHICTEILSCSSTSQGLLVLLCKARERGDFQGFPQPSSSSSSSSFSSQSTNGSQSKQWLLMEPACSMHTESQTH